MHLLLPLDEGRAMLAHRQYNGRALVAGNHHHVLVVPRNPGIEKEADQCSGRVLALAPDLLTMILTFAVLHRFRHTHTRVFLAALGNALARARLLHLQKARYFASTSQGRLDAIRGLDAGFDTSVRGRSLFHVRGRSAARHRHHLDPALHLCTIGAERAQC